MADRAYRHKAAEAFRNFVADVSRLQIGENEHIGMSGDRRAGSLEFAYGRNDGGIELELAVKL